MKAVVASLIVVVAVTVRNCDAFCHDIRRDPEAAVVVGECTRENLPAEFTDTLIQCVNGRSGRQVSWREVLIAWCSLDSTEMSETLDFCFESLSGYSEKNEAELFEGSDKADECLDTRLHKGEESEDAARRKRRSPFADALSLKKRSVYRKRRSPFADALSLKKRSVYRKRRSPFADAWSLKKRHLLRTQRFSFADALNLKKRSVYRKRRSPLAGALSLKKRNAEAANYNRRKPKRRTPFGRVDG